MIKAQTAVPEDPKSEARKATCLVFERPGKIKFGRRTVPFPGPGQLRVRIAACGICHRELHVLRGHLRRQFPTVMGHEPVGVVDAVGADVESFQVGDWVTGVGTASLAEYDLMEARFTAPLPDASAHPEHWLGEPAMCAVNAVNRPYWPERPVVVVWGVGFMGNLLIQAVRLKRNPSRLIAVDIEPRRLDLALEAGADEVVSAHAENLKSLLENPVDIIYEASGAPGTILLCTELLRRGGTLCLFAHHFGIQPEVINEWHLKGITVLNTVPWAAPDLGHEVREAVTALRTGGLRMSHLIDRTIVFREAATQLCAMASSREAGKTVVIIPRRRDHVLRSASKSS